MNPADSATWPIRCFDVEVTSRCNQACAYCYLGQPGGEDMSRETAAQVLAYIRRKESRQRPWDKVELNLYGGEPFLNFPIAQELAQEAQDAFGARVTIFTNGATATPEQVAWCLENSVLPKRSTAGCPEAAELTRPGDYTDRWLAEGALWRDFGVARRLTVTPKTARYVAQSIHWLHAQGYWGAVDLATDDYATWYPREVAAYSRNLKQLAREFVHQYRGGHVLGVENFLNFGRVIFGQSATKIMGCGAGWNTNAIDVRGRISPCHRFLREPQESPLCQNSISDILSGVVLGFGPAYAAWLSDCYHGRETEECRRCQARQCCQHGCLHVSLAACGTYNKSPAARCTFTRLYALLAHWIQDKLVMIGGRRRQRLVNHSWRCDMETYFWIFVEILMWILTLCCIVSLRVANTAISECRKRLER